MGERSRNISWIETKFFRETHRLVSVVASVCWALAQNRTKNLQKTWEAGLWSSVCGHKTC